MFDFFVEKNNRFLGVDFGTSSIKIAEILVKNKRPMLQNYGIVEINGSSVTHGDDRQKIKLQSYEQKLNMAFLGLLKKMEIKKGRAYVSIPGSAGLIANFAMPNMSDDELGRAIQFEAHKYIPVSLDEVVMSWEIVGRDDAKKVQDNKEGKVKILLVAAPKKEIERFDHLTSGSNLKIEAIELENFSIIRSLVGEDQGVHLLIDIGSKATNIILVEKGLIRSNRNIDIGGSEITEAIEDSMGISRQRAEMFKKGEKDLLNSSENGLVIPVLEFVLNEAKRIINAYLDQEKNSKIDSVILSGGTAKMTGLTTYFSNNLGRSVVLGDPWRKIEVAPEVAPILKELGASYTVALGLALRGYEEYMRK